MIGNGPMIGTGWKGDYSLDTGNQRIKVLNSSGDSDDYKYSISGKVLRLETIDHFGDKEWYEIPSPPFYSDPNSPYAKLASTALPGEAATPATLFVENLIAQAKGIPTPEQNTVSKAIPTPDQVPASVTLSSTIATPSTTVSVATPTPAPAEPVSSSNPVIYSGFFMNQRTGEQGDLVLKVEHFIDTGDGQMAFGGRLILGDRESNVSGSYSLTTYQISFSQGTQSQSIWSGGIKGDSIDGNCTPRTPDGGVQGIWHAKHSGGFDLQQAEKAYGGSSVRLVSPASPVEPASTPTPVAAPSTVQHKPLAHRYLPVQSVPVGPRYFVPQTVPAGPRYGPVQSVPVGPRYY